MSKERRESTRLEIIKTNWEYDHINTCDVDWLIEQAERVQDLEEIIYKDERQAVLEGLYEENKRYREALKEIEEHGIQEMFTELKELEDEE